MDQKTKEQIEAYLADEDKLMNDWYQALGQPDTGTDVRRFAGPGKIREIFDKWFEANRSVLVKICDKWYKWKEIGVPAAIVSVSGVIETMLPEFTIIVEVCTTSSILVTKGYLDDLCDKRIKDE